METRKKMMPMDHADFFEDRPVCTVSALVMLFLAWMFLPGNNCLAQNVPPFVVTTQTTLANSTFPPPTNPSGNAADTAFLNGAGFGALAVNKNGDVFVGGYNSNQVYEFPASGAAPFPVYTSDSSGRAGAVAVDPYGNLIVSEPFSSVLTMIPYINGTYTPFTNPTGGGYGGSTTNATVNPPVCTGTVNNGVFTLTSTTACSYDFPIFYYGSGVTPVGGSSTTNNLTGGYFQVASLAFDPAGNSFMATFGDSNNNYNIYECSVACNYSGAAPVQILHWSDPVTPTNKDQNYIDSIAVDAADDIFIANNSNTVWEVVAGTPGAQTVIAIGGFIDAQGVAFDSAGNLYITENGYNSTTLGGGGVYEIPLENGALNPSNMFLVFPLNETTKYPGYASPWNISEIGAALDQHGNIFQTQGYSSLFKYTVGNASLPATALPSTALPSPTPGTTTLTLTFDGSITLNSPAVTTAGVPSSEFSVIAPDTTVGACVFGPPANAPLSSCTVAVQFTPAEPGLRTATLTLTDTAGDSVPVTLSGVGVGQAITVDPGTPTLLVSVSASGWISPDAVAVDGVGNVFVADAGANKVYEYPLGAGPAVPLGSDLSAPGGVATDTAGNLYISDTGHSQVVMIPNGVSGPYTGTQRTLTLGNLKPPLKSPGQLAVDSNGTLYIPDTANNDVVSYVSRGGLASSVLTTTVPITGLNAPTAVAVGPNDDLYIADKGNNRVVVDVDGYIINASTNLNGPTGVALDGSDSIIIADNGNGRIVRVPLEAGVPTASDQTLVNNSIASPYAVTLDQYGNLYATDNSSANAAAYYVSRTSGAINFGQVNDTTNSAGQTAVLANSGQAGLTLGSPLYPPLSGTPFSISPSSSNGCNGGATLETGYGCELLAYFAPGFGVVGEQNYTVDFTTGAQNTASPSLTLIGNAVNLLPDTITLVQTAPSGNASYGDPVTVSATVASADSTSTTTPAGTVQFIVDGNNSGQPQLLNAAGTASLVLTGLTGGSHAIAASYAPSVTSIYAPVSSSTLTVVIVSATSVTTLAIDGLAANPLTAEPGNASNIGDTVSMIATIVTSVPGALSGPVVFSSGGTVLGVAQVVGMTTNSVTAYTATLITTGPTALAAGTYNVVATFEGNANYNPSPSAPVQLIITLPTFTLAESVSTVTSSAKSPGSMTITVTSESAFTGAVNLACTGLPANATCQFIPDVLSLATCTGLDANGNPCALPPFPGETIVPPLQTTLTVLVSQAPIVTPTGIFWWSGLLLGLSLFGLASNRNARRRLLMQCVAGCVLLGSLAGLSACNQAITSTTPSGTSTVTVTATATQSQSGAIPTQALNVSQSFTFTLTVQ
jgi:sugar lactone lactonase YvrE